MNFFQILVILHMLNISFHVRMNRVKASVTMQIQIKLGYTSIQKVSCVSIFILQETSFASNQPVTRSLSSVTNNNKSKLPLPKSVMSNESSNGTTHSVNNQNRINTKKTDLEKISPWLVSSDAIHTKKEKEKTKIPQLKTVITTEL